MKNRKLKNDAQIGLNASFGDAETKQNIEMEKKLNTERKEHE